MHELKKHINETKIYPVYLFYGEEKTVLQKLVERLIAKIIGEDQTMNLQTYDSTQFDLIRFEESVETMPFFASHRIVVLKYMKLFNGRNKTLPEQIALVIEKAPASTIIIVIEDDCDKRTSLYKTIQKKGFVDEFQTLKEEELVKMIGQRLAINKKKIELSTAHYFIQYVGSDYGTLTNEMLKLASYSEEEVITIPMIQEVCIRHIDHIIFDLIALLGKKERDKALLIYHDMIASKEPPLYILTMLVRQFRALMIVKQYVNEGHHEKVIVEKTNLKPFIVRKYIDESRNFNVNLLKQAVVDCARIDDEIKSGKINEVVGVETILLKYCK